VLDSVRVGPLRRFSTGLGRGRLSPGPSLLSWSYGLLQSIFTAMRSVASVERVLFVVGSLAGLDPEVFRFAAAPVDQGRPEILS
jgi:hypothetical protein